ncbi:2,3,4,5-tetrahydropyridine-2-carboxylate N-succinyltransferase-related protein [Thermotoga neapolitana DSM 4359]|uniref:2,3,4,5-tetrahydropyridine-2,6-dicarboxylate N-acetyltransferase n=1 Tax=Thermotoga neapolitana (strain ATCC 49049 / DSM 4359 / NBRC 107923 / NS-E) TaxID=309803 RepID=DAPH_THENN|nr:RecName: Full=2,3,4,5-tetrahydropyridine-2,6-dicarboxylate N-acetyltransferase; AltName: Full=Tetrahydrodipicolinate N-acetyltransferase; Short=THP acetyltransferase; Short=Tetrahydropicolinate acetylase [Thermotoga neapolitana DSM 4359]ACM23150.1 2,3,4,5-tetrahydropyridine-2-carboxylate N-succinyltransferase-related protein [Thermotoga neapolitana DSM 4359]
MEVNEVDAREIIEMIAKSKKKTPIVAYIKGKLDGIDFSKFKFFGNDQFGVLFGEYEDFRELLEKYGEKIEDYHLEVKARNSALPLADITKYRARIEPGAIIRDMVEIGEGAVIMMGAVINVGAVIGEGTMIDMNAVVGGRAIIGKKCHIGAGAVIAGVIEPPSAKPVVIEDEVVVGANAVILEGVTVGKGSVVAAGAVVTKDVPPYTVVAGVPARVIKQIDEKTKEKTRIVDELRNLE